MSIEEQSHCKHKLDDSSFQCHILHKEYAKLCTMLTSAERTLLFFKQFLKFSSKALNINSMYKKNTRQDTIVFLKVLHFK